jgi:predicted dithiol-disulfide oxidoreductase (DUF899 family)
MTIRFPNESDEYRSARNAVLEAEIELRSSIEKVAGLRRSLPRGGAAKEDYAFTESDGSDGTRIVHLSEMFPRKDNSLFLYSFMFGPQMDAPCPSCSSMLDALNGNATHIASRINLAVVARSPIERITEFAVQRGWNNLRMLSSAGCNYNADYFGESATGAQMPMANVFILDNGTVHHQWGTEMLYASLEGHPRHVDLIWPLWNVLDTTLEGRGAWSPALEP